MFDSLMESRRRREQRAGGTIASIAAHAAIVLLAVVATTRADPPPRGFASPEHPIWVDPASPRSGGATSAGRSSGESVRPTRPSIVFDPASIDIDVETPPPIGSPIDIGAVIGSLTTSGSSSSAGAGPFAPGDIFSTASVERIASLRAGSPTPHYPELLRAARLEGRVDVRFVVDTLGRIEPASPVILESTDPRFTAAVRDVLPRLRFTPALAAGRKVRMMVEMPFVFRIEGR